MSIFNSLTALSFLHLLMPQPLLFFFSSLPTFVIRQFLKEATVHTITNTGAREPGRRKGDLDANTYL
jgi:hypothetical protein